MAHQAELRLPHVQKLEIPLEPGQSIVIRGAAHGEKVVVNLAHGPEIDAGDIILHSSIRIKDKVIVLNSMNNGAWGKEERHKHTFEKGQPLIYRIRCHPNKFALFIDGTELGEYVYRQPLTTVNYVQVYGDLTLNSVGREGNYYSIPYKMWLTKNLGAGQKVHLTLVPDDEKFELNFMCNDDIAYHFTPRFFQKRTVCNTFVNGEWGKEEEVKNFPFTKKKGVDLTFEFDENKITAYVNGARYSTYQHRIDPRLINCFCVKGNLELQSVSFE